jgi:hypothetical protein
MGLKGGQILLHGKEYTPSTKADVLCNGLYQMGIYPNVRSFRLQHAQRFGSMEEAMEHFRHQYRISTTRQAENRPSHIRLQGKLSASFGGSGPAPSKVSFEGDKGVPSFRHEVIA